jgi:serine protease Do
VGLRLEKANAAQLQTFKNRYRGGMRVLDVRPKSIAADFGIKQGDILVGLHEWETVRWEDINYILNQNSLINGSDPVKFYVVRGQEVLYGNLKFASRPK